jgi:hypothetical protein
MTKDKEKVILRLKRNFPFVEMCLLASYVFVIIISCYKLLYTDEAGFIGVLIAVTIATFLFGLFFNNSNKLLTITDQRIEIRKWLFGQPIEFLVKDIKGFDLRENYDRLGLVKHVRIIIDDKEKFEFIKNSYSNYDKLVPGLKKAGLIFLGTVELKSKFKHGLALIVKISSIVAILGFLLVQLMKILR